MLSKVNTLKGHKLEGTDGKIGEVEEFYFDDHYWTIRYLVADTGTWLMDRQVLISPYALTSVLEEEKLITINMTKKQIEDSPSLDNDKPISRQFEQSYYGYYGWPNREEWSENTQDAKDWDPNLRSTHDVSGHHIQATDGEIGHIEDFIMDDETWAIRYLIINTRNWWPGNKVLVSPHWIERISWSESKVFVNLSRETIKQSPEYTEEILITRDYETGLHLHYNRKGYWGEESTPRSVSIEAKSGASQQGISSSTR